MVTLKAIILSQAIQLWGIADTGDAHLAILVAQTAEQLAEIQKLLDTANKSSKTLDRALELTRKAQEGIDKTLRTKRNTEHLVRTIKRLKETGSLKEARYNIEDIQDYMRGYKKMFPERAKRLEKANQIRKERELFKRTLDEDRLRELERISAEVAVAKPERANQLSADIQVKQLEQMMLLQEELYELRKQNGFLVEMEQRRLANEQMENIYGDAALKHAVKNNWWNTKEND